jgi:hypothetical protein
MMKRKMYKRFRVLLPYVTCAGNILYIRSFEFSIDNAVSTRHDMLGDLSLQQHRSENLKSSVPTFRVRDVFNTFRVEMLSNCLSHIITEIFKFNSSGAGHDKRNYQDVTVQVSLN